MTKKELKTILQKHKKWLQGKEGIKMKNKIEQQYEDQIIICKGLNLLKIYVDHNEISDFLTQEQQERLSKLIELEMNKLVMIEMELKNDK